MSVETFKKYGTIPRYDIYVDSPDPIFRCMAASLQYGLEKLISDEKKEVRTAVAVQNYGLDKLITDPDKDVRYTAEAILFDKVGKEETNKEKAIKKWVVMFPDMCQLTKNKQKQKETSVNRGYER